MALEVELDLLNAPALASIDEIGAALASLATQFEADLADALGVLAETADEEITLTVTEEGADEAQAELEATGLIAQEVDGQLVVIDVSAEGADEAAAALEEVGDQSATTTGAAAAAGASLDDLGSSASGAATGLLASALAIGGVTLGIGELFEGALDAQSGLESFQARTGDAAEEVERLDSTTLGLNTTLGDLALQLGSDDEQVRSAVARLFALGEAEGFAAERSDELIENVVAIAARARTLNPELGSLGDITESLGTRLQRGGRFVADFGISLTAADIQARALANTGKALASELTLLEKTEAAAQLATEQLGGSLGEDITANADNAAITFDRLKQSISEALEPIGAPLVSPVFELLESAGPILEDVGAVLADLGEIGLTAVKPIIDELEPLSDLWRQNAQDIARELRPAIIQLGKAVATFIRESGPAIEEFTDAFVEAAPAIAGLVVLLSQLVSVGAKVDGALGDVPSVLNAIVDTVPGLSTLRRTLELAGTASEAFAGETQRGGEIIEDGKGKVDDYSTAIDLANAALSAIVGVSREVTDETTQQEAALARSAPLWIELAAAIQAGREPTAAYQEIADRLGLTLEDVEGFADGVKGALAEFTATAIEKIPTITEVIGDLTEEFQAQPDQIILALQESEEAIGNFQANIRLLLAFGLDDLARLAIEKGPEFTNALVNTFAVGRPLLAQELEAQLEGAQIQLDALPGFFDDIAPAVGVSAEALARTASESFGQNVGFEETTEAELGRTVDAILRAGPTLELPAGDLAGTATEGYRAKIDLPGATQESADEVQTLLQSLGLTGSPLATAAEEAGSLIGNAFSIGLGNAIVDAAAPDGFLNLQVASAIDDLETAAAMQFDLSASVSGLPSGGGSGGDFIISIGSGAFPITVQGGGDGRSIGEAVAKGVEKGVSAAGRMLLTEVKAR